MSQMKKGFTFIAMAVIVLMIASFYSAAFAQEPAANVKKLLTEIKAYDYGQDREMLTELDIAVRDLLGNPEAIAQVEKEMSAFLQTDATFASKQYVCKQLSIIGTKESVPVLADMLKNVETADIALYALERNTAPEVDKALIKALGKAKGKTEIGIINSLGQRKSADAAKKLAKLVNDKDQAVAEAAIVALGKIGNETAIETLSNATVKASDNLKNAVYDAYLKCADSALKAGNNSAALTIYKELSNAAYPEQIQSAAFVGLVNADAANAPVVILQVLKGDNEKLKANAAGLVRNLPKDAKLQDIIAYLPSLSATGQVQMITALADRGETGAHSVIVKEAANSDINIQVAALTALAKIGTDADVKLLAVTAAEGDAQAKAAAQGSLYLLPGKAIDNKILALIPEVPAKPKVELITAVGERNIADAGKILLTTAIDADNSVKRESYKVLGLVGTPAQLDNTVDLLVLEENSGVRKEAEKTVVAIAQKMTENQTAKVIDAYKKTTSMDAKNSLLQVAGKIGDNNVLPVLKEALKDKNPELQLAAIRALSVWPNSGPKDDLLTIVKTSKNETQKVLALRGYIELIKNDKSLPADEAINLYQNAMDLSTDINEKRMVLSGLATLGTEQAFDKVASYMQVPELQPEAEAAILALIRNVRSDNNAEKIKNTLNTIVEKTQNDATRERAKMILNYMR